MDEAGSRVPGLPLASVSSSADDRDVVRLNDVICVEGSHCAYYVGKTPQIGVITVLRTQCNRSGEGKRCDLGMERDTWGELGPLRMMGTAEAKTLRRAHARKRQEVGYLTAQPPGSPLGYWIQASLDFPHL